MSTPPPGSREPEAAADGEQPGKSGNTVDRDGRRLLWWSLFGIALTGGISAIVLTVFVRLIDGGGPWLLTGHNLGQGEWFEATRVTVALVALTVAGGAAYLAYRRQRTADENQKTAAETQLINAQAYQLSVEQRGDTQRRELRTRFGDAAEQLAHSSPAVRIAGVYAMTALAADWHSEKELAEVQVCVDVLCGYLRLPHQLEVGNTHQTKRVVTKPRTHPDGTTAVGEVQEHYEFRHNDREVRQTIVRVIADRLQDADDSKSWSDLTIDLTGATLEDADFSGALLGGPRTSFRGVKFHGETTSFARAQFHGDVTGFDDAQFRSKNTWFDDAQFHSATTSFSRAQFHGDITWFGKAQFCSDFTEFGDARFYGNNITGFTDAQFYGQTTQFVNAQFHAKTTMFDRAQFHGEGTVFDLAQFHSETTRFVRVQFHSTTTTFRLAKFHGASTTFEHPGAWNHVYFDWDPRPPFAASAKPDNVWPVDWPPTERGVGSSKAP